MKAEKSTDIALRKVFLVGDKINPTASHVLTAERAEAYDDKLACSKAAHQAKINSWLRVLGLPVQVKNGLSPDPDAMQVDSSCHSSDKSSEVMQYTRWMELTCLIS